MQEKYSQSSILNIQDIANKELEKFTLSSFTIKPARKERKFVIIDSEDIIQEFKNLIKRNQFPKDQSLAIVLSALQTLEQPELAIQLFNLIEERVNPSIKGEVIGPHSYTALSYLNINELAKNRFEEFTVSSEIIQPARKERHLIINDSKAIIEEFKDIIWKYQFPEDECFAVVLSALRKLKQSEVAIQLFELIEERINPSIKDEVIDPHSYTALLQALRDLLHSSREDKKDTYLARIPILENICRQKKYMNDPFIINEFVCIYSDLGQFDLVEQTFSLFRQTNVPDLPLFSKYITCLIKQNNFNEAEKELLFLLNQYNSLKRSNQKIRLNDEHAVRVVYNSLIIAYYSTDLEKALEIFKAATEMGFYANNQLKRKTENGKDLVQLNFHLSENSREHEGGLPFAVAKVAFLYFMQQLSVEHVHFPAKLITGGRTEHQSTLKTDFPKYLLDEYDTKVEWNENKRLLEFVIPYEQLRKIKFIEDMFNGIEFNNLIHKYRNDLRRHNEGPSKPHSAIPTIPSYYGKFAYDLAKTSIDCYKKEDYGQCEKLRWQLVDYLLNDPWAYVQLGWILHRNDKFDKAIKCYDQAIEILQKSDQDKELLSDACRKMGWTFEWIHRKTETITDLEQALLYYSQALDADPNNLETYNNWGITLYRIQNYKEALEKFEKLHSLNPQHAEACDHMGNCHRELKNYPVAEKYYKQGIKLLEQSGNEKKAAYIYCDLGYLYLHQFEAEQDNEELFTKSKKAFETCIQLQITRDEAYTGLGVLYQLKKDELTAQNYYNLAKKYLPMKNDRSHHKANDAENDNNASPSQAPASPMKSFTLSQNYSHFMAAQQYQSKQQLNNNESNPIEVENVHKTVSTTAFDTSRAAYTDTPSIFKSNNKTSTPSFWQCHPSIKRDPLHTADKVETLLKSYSHIPADFQLGTAIGQGDCFFDAVAQGLNQLMDKQGYDVKSLRLLCEAYAKTPSHTWVKTAVLKDNDNYEQYLTRIAFTVEEMASVEWNIVKDPAVWGRPHIEGRMICEQYDIQLHVIEVLKNEDQSTYVMEQLVTKQDSRSIEPMAEDAYTDARTLHVVVYRNHFVPILPKATYNNEQKQKLTQFNGHSQKMPKI